MRRRMLISMAMVLVAFGSLNASAKLHGDRSHPAGGQTDAPVRDHEGAAEPEFHLLTIDAMTALWTIVVFVVLLIVLRAAAFKPIQEMLIRRERYIEDSLTRAKTEREEAERLLQEYTEQLNKARDEASAIVEEGRRDAEVLRHRIEQEARAEADATIERAKREIQIARETAVKGLYDLTARLVTDVASRVIGKELNPSDHEALVADSINALSETAPGSQEG